MSRIGVGSTAPQEREVMGAFAVDQGSRGGRTIGADVLRGVVEDVLRRRPELVAAQPAWPWARILPASVPSGGTALRDTAVLCNMTALAAAPRGHDYDVLGMLLRSVGPARVAHLQHAVSATIEPAGHLPIGNTFTTSLTPLVYLTVDDAPRRAGAGRLEQMCAIASLHFLLRGMDKGIRAARPLRDAEELRYCFEEETLLGRRRQLVNLVRLPWSPYAREIMTMAAELDEPGYVDGLGFFIDALRAEVRTSERQVIAVEIGRLVASTTLTRPAFAELLGISPERMAAYLDGSATPSTTTLLQIRRIAAQARVRRLPAPAGSSVPDAAPSAAGGVVELRPRSDVPPG